MTLTEHRGSGVGLVEGAGVRAWLACMERREEEVFERLMAHVPACGRCTRADQVGALLDGGRLCPTGSLLLSIWDAAEDAIAAAVLPAATVA